MRIQLDTTLKTIKIKEDVNLGELTDALGKLLPDNLWKEFKLETNTIINWSNPIIVKPYLDPYPYPWWRPVITHSDGTAQSTHCLNEGVYDVQLTTI